MTGHISLDDYDFNNTYQSCPEIDKLVGGFNPFEKWESSPSRGETAKSLKPQPSKYR